MAAAAASSSQRNVSDVLMANARANAQKKSHSNQKKKNNTNLNMADAAASSSQRNVSDVLMSNARANAQNKSHSSSSSSSSPNKPKKAKKEQEQVRSFNLKADIFPLKRKADSDFSPEKKPKTLEQEEQVPKPKEQASPFKKVISSPPKKGKKEDVLEEWISQLKKKASDFMPQSAAYWKQGEPVPFLFLARAFELINNESSRITKTEILSNVFRTVIATTPGDLIAAVYLAVNKLAPSLEGVELGIGDTCIKKALVRAYDTNKKHIQNQLSKLGDLGLVAKGCRASQSVFFKPPPLTVVKVLDTLRVIAKESGIQSEKKKRDHISRLLVAASDCESLYLIRILESKLRTGLAEQGLLVALGQASVYSERRSAPPSHLQSSIEEATKVIKQVYSVCPNYDKVVTALLNGGVWKLSVTCSFTPGVPVGPMTAKRTNGVSEILDKFQDMEFTCEYKYDGERAQIHYMDDGSVEIYSRNAKRNTGKYPDVVKSVESFRKSSVGSFVLDCEVVAHDRAKNKILPFQDLRTRPRKEVERSEITVKVCIYAFDILYLNGQSLLQEQLKVRREHLYASFKEIPGEFQFATAMTSNDLEEIQKFLEAAVNDSCEGLVVKTLNKEATYEPAKRSNNWLKLKKDYSESVGDSLDLVPIAAFHGQGKRTGVYGSFLLACYDDEDEVYQSICNIGSGFSEAMLEERSASLRSKVIIKSKSYYRYSDKTKPDVWFEPTEVWEVKAADLSISPVYHAATGLVDPNKGISLRFPRLLRVREDKNPEQATSSKEVAEMYRGQKINHTNNQNEEG